MQLTGELKETILEKYFENFRNQIIGINHSFESPYGTKKIVYADWVASGRMYRPIEELFLEEISPFVANTHTESTTTGCSMTNAYREAKKIIKNHVNASSKDIIISSNSGMTGVVNKFQRILGLKVYEKYFKQIAASLEEKPLVIITHMEHHSNQTSWLETLADVEIINPCSLGMVNLDHLDALLEKHKDRKIKFAAVTSCSNVTGIISPYHEIAKKMHQAGGYCFVDFACSAPYIDIDMHPSDPEAYLDAVFFSPHKFLGGPSSSGILIFNEQLYKNRVPDNPGGGTVDWTNPWGEHKYHEEIEEREDGGTPSFLQTMRVALCIKLKEEMGVENIRKREDELIEQVWPIFDAIPNLHILASDIRDRLGVISFYIENIHYNLAVKILNDRFGIQLRGGCSCAGTYGHFLLQVTEDFSKSITDKINHGDLSSKPGWIRMSLHPTMTDSELQFVLNAIKELAYNHQSWSKDYKYDSKTNEFVHLNHSNFEERIAKSWFSKSLK